jgi:hypothetical protein
LKTGISKRNRALKTLNSKTENSVEDEGEENYRYPDFGFSDDLNYGREENKKTIWQMLLDHVSGENHNERINNIISLYKKTKQTKIKKIINQANQNVRDPNRFNGKPLSSQTRSRGGF